MKPLWKVKGFFNRTSWKVSDVQIVRYTWVLSVSLSLCLSVCLCVCVAFCVLVCVVCCRGARGCGCGGGGGRGGGGGGREEKGETNRTIWAKVSLKIAETEQLCHGKRMIGGIGDMLFFLNLFSIYSQT